MRPEKKDMSLSLSNLLGSADLGGGVDGSFERLASRSYCPVSNDSNGIGGIRQT
jgi:hypothetical protein